ncbi:unnamed protein product [Staurois parvus]|uniref:Uncharacterized protein n=2 Tax=Staurois parvus TaxID=386267 RepID=A0ABN9DTL7_9NEOB|nr:unnamed protein product [Staurois parvus]
MGPVSLPKLKKAYEKGTRGISWGPLLTPGPRAVPEFPNGQSAPVCALALRNQINSDHSTWCEQALTNNDCLLYTLQHSLSLKFNFT